MGFRQEMRKRGKFPVYQKNADCLLRLIPGPPRRSRVGFWICQRAFDQIPTPIHVGELNSSVERPWRLEGSRLGFVRLAGFAKPDHESASEVGVKYDLNTRWEKWGS